MGLLFSALGFLAGSVFLVAVNWPAAIPVVVAVGAAGVVATNRMISGAGSADEEFDPIEVVLAEAREYPPSESRGVAEARAIFRRLLPVTRAAVAGAGRGERRA